MVVKHLFLFSRGCTRQLSMSFTCFDGHLLCNKCWYYC